MKRLNLSIFVVCLAIATIGEHADAQRRGGGGARGGGGMRGGGGGMRGGGGMSRPSGGMSRSSARSSVTSRPSRPSGGSSFSRPSSPSGGGLANRPNAGAGAGGNRTNISGGEVVSGGNRSNIGNGNRTNVGRGDRTNISSDRPINIQDNDVIAGGGHWGGDYHGGCCYGWGGVGAGFVAGAVTGAIIGSTVWALPPSCPVTVVGGVPYNHCGGVWYQPQFQGTEANYIVVESPQGAPPESTTAPPQ